jgi:hypothetical protein
VYCYEVEDFSKKKHGEVISSFFLGKGERRQQVQLTFYVFSRVGGEGCSLLLCPEAVPGN